MYYCSDCDLPVCLDDVVTVFRDGTCLCLACHNRFNVDSSPVPSVLHELAALLAALDAR